jgi:hypothetical protein
MSTYSNPLTEYSPQMEAFEFTEEREFGSGQAGGVFSENEEMELAAELLEVASEQELDQFIGDLIKKAGHAFGKFANSSVGRAVGGVLKTVASKALPIAGGALGGLVGGPLGATLGSGLANMAGQALGLELEGLSPEDREFEATKQFVRFAGETARKALEAAPGSDPVAAAKAAAKEAAQLHAPGLMDAANAGSGGQQKKRHSGRWIRRHGQIILLGI